MSDFSPAWFLPGPHAQTIWGRLARPRRLVETRREILTTPDGDELVLDHLDPPEPSENPIHFVLMHGLEGSAHSVYMQGILSVIERHGHAATALNFRSCARDLGNIMRMLPNRRPRFYHSGETGDFDFTIRTLAARHPDRRFVAFGASLGGNVLLKWLGECGAADTGGEFMIGTPPMSAAPHWKPAAPLVSAAATLSVPYDLGAGARHLETSAAGRFYVARFLKTLKKKALRDDIAALLDTAAVVRSRTFEEFDDAATAPLHGFTSADDYYTRSSSIHYVGRIATPTLALNAEDDPFLPNEVLPRAKAAVSAAVDFRTTPAGGHVGFIGGSAPWRCEYWAEELVVRWLVDKAESR